MMSKLYTCSRCRGVVSDNDERKEHRVKEWTYVKVVSWTKERDLGLFMRMRGRLGAPDLRVTLMGAPLLCQRCTEQHKRWLEGR